jgi:hypothetical protein
MLYICCAIIQAEVTVLCLLVSLHHNTVIYTAYELTIKHKYSINVLYFSIDFIPLFKT